VALSHDFRSPVRFHNLSSFLFIHIRSGVTALGMVNCDLSAPEAIYQLSRLMQPQFILRIVPGDGFATRRKVSGVTD
jgi:hypothetical protein